MHATKKIKLQDIIPNITCKICKGYFIDATTISECLHSFCKSCIVTHLQNNDRENAYCPVCDVQLHSSRPLLSIHDDNKLQEIVYKLVPGLFRDEMERRQKFYKQNLSLTPVSQLDAGIDLGYNYITSDEIMQVSLEYKTDDSEIRLATKRFIKCTASVSLNILKKLIQGKYDLSNDVIISFYFGDRLLPDDFLLMDISYKYSWRVNGKPLELSYLVYGTEFEEKIKSKVKRRELKRISSNNNLNKTKSPKKIKKSSIKSTEPMVTSNSKSIEIETNGIHNGLGLNDNDSNYLVKKSTPKKRKKIDKPKTPIKLTNGDGEETGAEIQLKINENGIISAKNIATGEDKIISTNNNYLINGSFNNNNNNNEGEEKEIQLRISENGDISAKSSSGEEKIIINNNNNNKEENSIAIDNLSNNNNTKNNNEYESAKRNTNSNSPNTNSAKKDKNKSQNSPYIALKIPSPNKIHQQNTNSNINNNNSTNSNINVNVSSSGASLTNGNGNNNEKSSLEENKKISNVSLNNLAQVFSAANFSHLNFAMNLVPFVTSNFCSMPFVTQQQQQQTRQNPFPGQLLKYQYSFPNNSNQPTNIIPTTTTSTTSTGSIINNINGNGNGLNAINNNNNQSTSTASTLDLSMNGNSPNHRKIYPNSNINNNNSSNNTKTTFSIEKASLNGQQKKNGLIGLQQINGTFSTTHSRNIALQKEPLSLTTLRPLTTTPEKTKTQEETNKKTPPIKQGTI